MDAVSATPSDRWDAERLDDARYLPPGGRFGAFYPLAVVASFDVAAAGVRVGAEATQPRPTTETPRDERRRRVARRARGRRDDASRRFESARRRGSRDIRRRLGERLRRLPRRRRNRPRRVHRHGKRIERDVRSSPFLRARRLGRRGHRVFLFPGRRVYGGDGAVRRGDAENAAPKVAAARVSRSRPSCTPPSAARGCSPSGRCKTLDADADGYVRAEACRAILVRGGEKSTAIVAGAAVNQDGRSSSLTAPNGPSQTAAIRAAMEARDRWQGHVGRSSRRTARERRSAIPSRSARGSRGVLLRRRRRGGAHKVGLVFGRGSRGGQVVVRPRGARGGRARSRDAVSSDVPRHRARSVSSPRDEPARRRGGGGDRRNPTSSSTQSSSSTLFAARQTAPVDATVGGVSAFAFQGTNAHVLVVVAANGSTVGVRFDARIVASESVVAWPTPTVTFARGAIASVGVPSSSASKSTARFTLEMRNAHDEYGGSATRRTRARVRRRVRRDVDGGVRADAVWIP